MNKPAFIVEGHLEQDFVQAICQGAPVRRIGCNGSDVSMEVLAKFVSTQARILQRKFNPIVVVFDREGRRESCEELENALRIELKKMDVTATVVIGIPDRDIETWILADIEMLSKTIGAEELKNTGPFEGNKCKHKLKSMVMGKCFYSETNQGVEWLKKARPHCLKQNSNSFSRFYEELKGLRCWWLEREVELL